MMTELALAQLFGRKIARRKRLPRQSPPSGVERDYLKSLLSFLAELESEVRGVTKEGFGLVESAARERRFDIGESGRWRSFMERLRIRVRQAAQSRRMFRLIQEVAQRTEVHNTRQLGKVVLAATGVQVTIPRVGVASLVDAFVGENISLITSVTNALLDRVENIVARAISNGTSQRDLAKELEVVFKLPKVRARLIARDQVNKLYGQVNAVKQQALGVTHFIWRTVRDERVRNQHKSLEGKRYAYNKLPDEGLPGQPIQCRCYGEPVFDGLI